MSHTNAYAQLLVAEGFSLQDLGLKEVALLRADALQAVELLRASSVPILGGDVYFLRGESVEHAFADWYADPHPGEGRPEYAARSCRHSAKYIEEFPHRQEVTPLFVLVVSHEVAR